MIFAARSEIAEIAWVTGADRDCVTHAERQVMARLMADGRLQVELTPDEALTTASAASSWGIRLG